MFSLTSFFFFLLGAAAAVLYRDGMSAIPVMATIACFFVVARTCAVRSPEPGLTPSGPGRPKQSHVNDVDEGATVAGLKKRVEDLVEQVRGLEASRRFSEEARQRDNNRHVGELRDKDAQLTSLRWRLKESQRAKDQVICESRQWRRKFEDLESLQQQGPEEPVRGMKGCPRWAPAKSNGIAKRERGHSTKKFTAVAQVATVNAAWEAKMVELQNQARDYVARQADQIQNLNAAVASLSTENKTLREQSGDIAGNSEMLAQQHLFAAKNEIMMIAERKHEEIVSGLEQTHREELTAAKNDHEEIVRKLKMEFEEEKNTLAVQQVKQHSDTSPAAHLLSTLRKSNAEMAEDVQTQREEQKRLQVSNAEVHSQMRALEEEHQRCNLQQAQFLHEIADLRTENSRLESELERQISLHEDANSRFDIEREDLQAELAQLILEVNAAKEEADIANSAMEEMYVMGFGDQPGDAGSNADDEPESAFPVETETDTLVAAVGNVRLVN